MVLIWDVSYTSYESILLYYLCEIKLEAYVVFPMWGVYVNSLYIYYRYVRGVSKPQCRSSFKVLYFCNLTYDMLWLMLRG